MKRVTLPLDILSEKEYDEMSDEKIISVIKKQLMIIVSLWNGKKMMNQQFHHSIIKNNVLIFFLQQ